MLTRTKEILTAAKENHYGIVALDFWDLNSARDAAIEVVHNEKLKSYMRVQQAADEGIRNVLRHYISLLTK